MDNSPINIKICRCIPNFVSYNIKNLICSHNTI